MEAFYDVGNDRDNRVVILTGAGDTFCKEITAEGFDFFTPEGYDKIFKEGRRILDAHLNIEVPMIAAINGSCLNSVKRRPGVPPQVTVHARQ